MDKIDRPHDLNGEIRYLVRWKLGISLAEYAFCNIIHKLQANPSSQVPGWCYASNDFYSKYLGYSDRGIQKLKNRMILTGLIRRNKDNEQLLRTTQVWFDVAELGFDYDQEKNITIDPRTLFTL